MPKEYETSEQREKRELDEELDRQLRDTFPASAPPKNHATSQANRTEISRRRHWTRLSHLGKPWRSADMQMPSGRHGAAQGDLALRCY